MCHTREMWKLFGFIYDLVRIITSFDISFCDCLDNKVAIAVPQDPPYVALLYEYINECLVSDTFHKKTRGNYHLAVYNITVHVFEAVQKNDKFFEYIPCGRKILLHKNIS